jgi:hypothetical protein
MSFESAAKALQVQGLKSSAKLVLIGIASHEGDGGSWPSLATLATYAGVNVRSAKRLVRDLEDGGYIDVILNGGGTQHTRNDRRPNRYTTTIERGVKRNTKIERGVMCEPDGVSPVIERGVIESHDGVSPVTPELVLEPVLELIHEPVRESVRDIARSFEMWWDRWPKKQGRAEAEKRWIKMSGFERSMAFDALPGWESKARHDGSQFVPMGSTWLNQARWLDDPPAVDVQEIVRRPMPGRAGIEAALERGRLADAQKEIEAPSPRSQ